MNLRGLVKLATRSILEFISSMTRQICDAYIKFSHNTDDLSVVNICREWQSTSGLHLGNWTGHIGKLIQYGAAIHDVHLQISPLPPRHDHKAYLEWVGMASKYQKIRRELDKAGLNRLMLNDITSRLRWCAIEAHRKRQSC